MLPSRKAALRIAIAGGITSYYMTVNCDPFVSSTWKWNIHDVGLLSYWLGFWQQPEGFVSPKPSISPDLQRLIDQVKGQINMEPKHLEQITLVPSAQLLLGRTLGKTPGTAYCVIPDYFNVSSLNDLKADKLSRLIKEYYGVHIDKNEEWLSEEGKLLIQSFILSDKAKKFVITRQLISAQHSPVLLKVITVFASSYGYFLAMDALLRIALKSDQAIKQVPVGKLAFFSLIPLAFIYLIWKVYSIQMDTFHYSDSDARAITNNKMSSYDLDQLSKKIEKARLNKQQVDEEIVEKISNFNFEMVEGAGEYYSKLITRHLALKDICLKRGNWFDLTHRRFNHQGRFKRNGWKINFVPDPYRSLTQIRQWMNFIR